MKLPLLIIALASSYHIQMFSYSYWIGNDTGDKLYVQLHTTGTIPIKDEKNKMLGKLIPDGGHADGSEILPRDFQKLIIGTNPGMTENRAEIDLTKLPITIKYAHNINFTIKKDVDDAKQLREWAKKFYLPVETVREAVRRMPGARDDQFEQALGELERGRLTVEDL